MKARARTALLSLAMLGLAAGAVLAAWLGVERRDLAAEAAREREEKVFAFAAAEVKELVVRAKGEETRLAREGDGWRVTAPVQAEADRFAADAIAEKLASLRRRGEVAPAPGGDLARFGLAAPRVTVEATLAGGRRETLALGDQSAFDGAVFARPTSGAVLAVPADARFALERGTADLRRREPSPPPPAAPAAGSRPAAAPDPG